MATKIKLMRLGKMRAPYYRIVVADARNKRDGRAIETIGKYHPKEDPSFIEVQSERAQYWLGVGAQPTEAVTAILKVTGDWQQFKGLPAPPPIKVAAPRADKKLAFQEAARASFADAAPDATTPRSRGKARVPGASPGDKPAGDKAVDEPTAEPAADTAGGQAVDKAADDTASGSAGPTADQMAATAAEDGQTLTEARAAESEDQPAESPPVDEPDAPAPTDAPADSEK